MKSRDILRWKKLPGVAESVTDLKRIDGVGDKYSVLLKVAGVDSVKELGTRRADSLHRTLIGVIETKGFSIQPPSVNKVQDWIFEARSLPGNPPTLPPDPSPKSQPNLMSKPKSIE